MAEVFERGDAFLLALVAKGDHSAFKQLFRRYQNKVLGIALSISKSRVEAEDCVQQVFMRIWARRNTLDKIQNFEAFLRTCATNEGINRLKRSLRIELLEDPAELTRAVERTPSEDLEVKGLQEFFHEARKRLPPQQRRAFDLSRDRSLSIAQIAVQLNIAESTVKEHISKAIQSLRKQYQGYLKLEILVFLGINFFFY